MHTPSVKANDSATPHERQSYLSSHHLINGIRRVNRFVREHKAALFFAGTALHGFLSLPSLSPEEAMGAITPISFGGLSTLNLQITAACMGSAGLIDPLLSRAFFVLLGMMNCGSLLINPLDRTEILSFNP